MGNQKDGQTRFFGVQRMTKYRIEMLDGGDWTVFEILSGMIIATFTDRTAARKFKRQCEGGRGFGGFTPKFILQKAQINA
ncbi:MAG: hypothetical protein HOO10_11105 [Candidatus Marinimicrobia bacterium]|nr:hypothetical protein [Candidatus Neomarinimicrobiota bacterium]